MSTLESAATSDDWILEAIEAQRRQRPLYAYPPAQPLPEQVATVEGELARARDAGLALPPFVLTWVRGDLEGPYDYTGLYLDGTIEVWLSSSISLDGLALTVLHEAQHVADAAIGRLSQPTALESEQRAIDFACRMWRWR